MTAALTQAAEAYVLNYGGRITEVDGRPVVGEIDILVEFFDDEQSADPVASYTAYAVTLRQGTFSLNIDLTDAELHQAFPSPSLPVFIKITDLTNSRSYPLQALRPVPYALKVPIDDKTITYDTTGRLQVNESEIVSKINSSSVSISGDRISSVSINKIQELDVTTNGPSDGQFLMWNATDAKWVPASVSGANGGTVTQIDTGDGLSGGSISTSGTIDLDLQTSGGLSKTLGAGSNQLGIAANSVTSSMISDGTITNDDLNASAAIDSSKVSFIDDVLSGDKIHGGKVSSFSSTGIDDDAIATVLKIQSSLALGGLDIIATGCDTPGQADFDGTPDLSNINSGDAFRDEAGNVFEIATVDDGADRITFSGTCVEDGTDDASIHKHSIAFGSGLNLVNDTGSDTALSTTASAATATPLIVTGAASQSANLTEWKDDSGTTLLSVDNSGHLVATGSATVRSSDGSALAPSLGFSNDPDTGLFSASTNQIGFATAGAQRMVIDDNGYLGIGTDSPAGILHVDTTGNDHSLLINDTNGRVSIMTNSATSALNIGGDRFIAFHGGNSIISANTGLLSLRSNGSTPMVFNGPQVRVQGADYGAALNVPATSSSTVPVIIRGASGQSVDLQRWQDNAGTAMVVVQADGDVGIGESSPQAVLDIASPEAAEEVLRVGRDGIIDRRLSLFSTGRMVLRSMYDGGMSDDAVQMWSKLNRSNDGFITDGLQLTTDVEPTAGNSAHNGLHVNGTINQTGTSTGISRGVYVNQAITSAPDYRAIETGIGNVIINNGRLGLGTSAPTSSFHLYEGTAAATELRITNSTTGQAASDGFEIGISSTGEGRIWNRENQNVLLGTNNLQQMVIENTGDVGIGLTDPNYKLDVDGDVNISAGSSYLTAGADYAEYFLTNDLDLAPGDVVGIHRTTGLVRSYRAGDSLLGVVSTQPGVIGNADVGRSGGGVLVALMGQVPVDRSQVVIREGEVFTRDGSKLGLLLASGDVYLKIEPASDTGQLQVKVKELQGENRSLRKKIDMITKYLCDADPEAEICH